MRWLFASAALLVGCAAGPSRPVEPPRWVAAPREAAPAAGSRSPPASIEAVATETTGAASTPVASAPGSAHDLVERTRGLRFARPVAVLHLDAAAFAARVAHATRAKTSPSSRLVRLAFGLGPSERAAHADVARGKYVGLYDFRVHELFVRDDLGTREEGVVAHELVHALQDQHFGLLGEEAPPDEALALEALYEGDAVLVRERIAAARAGEDERTFLERAASAIEQLPSEAVARAVGAPPHVVHARAHEREEVLFPYLAGFRFAVRLYLSGGNAALDDAYARPPQTTREVLHPEHYSRSAQRAALALPVESGDAKAPPELGELGELRTGLVLGRCGGGTKDRTSGFVADRFAVVSAARGAHTLFWRTKWETEADAARFAVDLQRARQCFPSGTAATATVVRGTEVAFVRGPRATRAAAERALSSP